MQNQDQLEKTKRVCLAAGAIHHQSTTSVTPPLRGQRPMHPTVACKDMPTQMGARSHPTNPVHDGCALTSAVVSQTMRTPSSRKTHLEAFSRLISTASATLATSPMGLRGPSADVSQHSLAATTSTSAPSLCSAHTTEGADQLSKASYQISTPLTSEDLSEAALDVGSPFQSARDVVARLVKTKSGDVVEPQHPAEAEAQYMDLFMQLSSIASRFHAEGATTSDLLSLTKSAVALATDPSTEKQVNLQHTTTLDSTLHSASGQDNPANKSHASSKDLKQLPPTLSITDGIPRPRSSELPSLSSAAFSGTNSTYFVTQSCSLHQSTPTCFLAIYPQTANAQNPSASELTSGAIPAATGEMKNESAKSKGADVPTESFQDQENTNPQTGTQVESTNSHDPKSNASTVKSTPTIGTPFASMSSHPSATTTSTPRGGPHTPATRSHRRFAEVRFLDTIAGTLNKPDVNGYTTSSGFSSLLQYPVPASAIQHRPSHCVVPISARDGRIQGKVCQCTKNGSQACEIHSASNSATEKETTNISAAKFVSTPGCFSHDDNRGFAGLEVFTAPIDAITIASRHIPRCDKLEASPVSILGVQPKCPSNEAAAATGPVPTTVCHPPLSFTPTTTGGARDCTVGTYGLYFNQAHRAHHDASMEARHNPIYFSAQGRTFHCIPLPSNLPMSATTTAALGVAEFTLPTRSDGDLRDLTTSAPLSRQLDQYTTLQQSSGLSDARMVPEQELAQGLVQTAPAHIIAPVDSNAYGFLGPVREMCARDDTASTYHVTEIEDGLTSPVKFLSRKRPRFRERGHHDALPSTLDRESNINGSDASLISDHQEDTSKVDLDVSKTIVRRVSMNRLAVATSRKSPVPGDSKSSLSQESAEVLELAASMDSSRQVRNDGSTKKEIDHNSQEATETQTENENTEVSLGIIIPDDDPVVEYLMELRLTVLDGLLQMIKPLSQLPRRFHVGEDHVVAWWPVDVPKKHVSKLSKRDKISVIVAIMRYVADGITPDEFLDRMTQRLMSSLEVADSLRTYIESTLTVLFQSKVYIDPEEDSITPNSVFLFKEPHTKGRSKAAGLRNKDDDASDTEQPTNVRRKRNSSSAARDDDTSSADEADTDDGDSRRRSRRRTRSATLRSGRNHHQSW